MNVPMNHDSSGAGRTSSSRSPSSRSLSSPTSFWGRAAFACGFALVLAAQPACSSGPKSPEDEWTEIRKSAQGSSRESEVADWLLLELLSPGGSPAEAKKARKRLDEIEAKGLLAEFGRGLDDLAHGKPGPAGEAFFRAVVAASQSEDERAPLIAWFAAQHAYELSSQSKDFGKRHRAAVERLLAEPGHIGFRAYATVVDLWMLDAAAAAEKDIETKIAKRLGCVSDVRIAGPFGLGAESEILRSYAPEKPGPWPVSFDKQKYQTFVPHVIDVTRSGCDVDADESVPDGVFYAESFVTVDAEQDVILTASGAFRLWVDDQLVLDRDPRQWGIWPKFGVRARLTPGKHRLLWKLSNPSTSLRVVRPDGRPLPVRASDEPGDGYALEKVRLGADPNELMRFIKSGRVEAPDDVVTRFLAAYLADFEGQPDVATVIFEPLVKEPTRSTGIALVTAAGFVEGDPIYDATQTRDLVHELEVRAVERDAALWAPQLRSAIWESNQKGTVAAVEPLEKLVAAYPDVPNLHYTLAHVYEELGWGPELERVVRRIIDQFPDSPDAIELGIDLFDGQGDRARVEKLLAHLVETQPDTDVLLSRALRRRDYDAAIAELRRLGARRPDRKDIAERIADVMVRAGNTEKVWERLEKAVEREPRDVHAKLALADARFSRGDKGALARALVAAVQSGADAGLIEEAIDLVEGVTVLEPYRLDARQVVAEYEKRGTELPGTAARVLDYGAVLVRSDGSSRFLEHEVVRIQSEEGIRQFAEMGSEGLVLHLRVLKKDGRVLEPEAVSGKATATMPHLEIGDYVEIERILSHYSDGSGQSYRGPTWYFREENIAYARSEFVVVSPRGKELLIETAHGVPEPTITEDGAFIARRYRVDDSPAAPSEPNSPPASEFMPRVSVSWGVSFEERIDELARSLVPMTPVDPRLVRIAEKIVQGIPKNRPIDRARRLYHWVLDSVQEGEESDGRRVVVSRNGNHWKGFETLCQSLDIPVRWAVAQSRIASPVEGPISSVDRPLFPLFVVGAGKDATWLTIDDRFNPFGTIPGHVRGEEAYLLGDFAPDKARVPAAGAIDGVAYEGNGVLGEDGSAKLSIRIRFLGNFAASLRNGLSQIPESQLGSVIESRLLGQYLQGARLERYEVVDGDKLDQPLTLAVEVEVPQFATPTGTGFLLAPPFMPRLSQLTTLATRVTPLLIADTNQQSLDLTLTLPPSLEARVAPTSGTSAGSRYDVKDTAQAGSLHLVRTVKTEAGRIAPAAYPGFQSYSKEADAALSRAVRLEKKR